MLSAYFQPDESPDIRDAQLSWWCDELQDWTCEQVVYALRKWNRDQPRRRPTPGDVVALLKQIRGRKIADQMRRERPPPQAPRERPTPERAAQIMAEAGIPIKRFGGDA